MRLTLSLAELHRHLNYDSYMPKDRLVEIEMSPTQFADLITSANVGVGVPVTIRWVKDGGRVPDCPAETKRQQFEQEFDRSVKKVMSNVSKLSERAKELLAKSSLLKAEREELRGLIYSIEQDCRANLPFVQSMFNEQMDRTVSEAKGETEAFVENMIHSIGVEGLEARLKEYAPQIQDGSIDV